MDQKDRYSDKYAFILVGAVIIVFAALSIVSGFLLAQKNAVETLPTEIGGIADSMAPNNDSDLIAE